MEEKYPGWNMKTCNDENESFTSWNYTKYSDELLLPLECFMFCFLVFTSWIHNQYREADIYATRAFRFQILLTVLVIAQSIILLFIPGEQQAFISAFARPLFIVSQFRVLRVYL